MKPALERHLLTVIRAHPAPGPSFDDLYLTHAPRTARHTLKAALAQLEAGGHIAAVRHADADGSRPRRWRPTT